MSLAPPVLPRSEDVLWSALFVLAVVARDTSSQFVVHMLALVRAGVLPALEHALAAYRSTMDAQVGSCCDLPGSHDAALLQLATMHCRLVFRCKRSPVDTPPGAVRCPLLSAALLPCPL